MRRHSKLVALLLALALSSAAGCGVYSTSQGRVDKNIQRVHVEYLVNSTKEPNLGVDLSDAIIRAIQDDNTLKIVRQPDADAIIGGRVTLFDRRPLAARQDLTVDEYQLRIAVTLSFTVRATGEALFKDKRFRGTGTYILNDPTGQTDEASAKETAATEIVRDILAQVVEDW